MIVGSWKVFTSQYGGFNLPGQSRLGRPDTPVMWLKP